MKTLMRGMALLAIAFPANASATAGVAEISRVSGLVRIARAQSVSEWIEARPSMALYAQDRVRTLETANARAEIRFSNGSLIKLGNRTTLEIKEVALDSRGELRKVATRLWSGVMRAVVSRLGPQDEFTVVSSHAVASVKGTDFVFDGSTVTVIDEGDSTEHKVLLSDLAGTKVLEILEGMYGGINADGSVTKPTGYDSRFLDDILKDVGAGASGAAPSGENAVSKEDLRADLADFLDSQGMGELHDTDERINDLQTGKVLMDMNGYRVRAEEYLFRPRLDTVELLVLNTREGGPHAGLTYLQNDMVFNRDLPDNFDEVRRGIPAALADPTREPEYWQTEDRYLVKSPAGDFIRRARTFSTPEPIMTEYAFVIDATTGAVDPYSYDPFSGTWTYNEGPPQAGWGQQEERWVWVGTAKKETLKEHFRYDRYGTIEAGWYAGCLEEYPNMIGDMYAVNLYIDNPVTSKVEGMPDFGEAAFGVGTRETFNNALGGVTDRTNYGDGTRLDVSRYAVTDEGMVVTPEMVGAVLTGEADPSILGTSINFEVVFEASEFADTPGGKARSIDILIPQFSFEDAGPVPESKPVPDTSPPGGN